MADPILYKVRDKITGTVIHVDANNRAQAHRFASYSRFDITPVSVREALHINPKDVLDATKDPDQEPLPLDEAPLAALSQQAAAA